MRQAIFDSDFFGHGGEKRTAQISNLLTANNIEYILVPGLVKQKISLAFLKNLVLSVLINIKIGLRLRSISSILNMVKRIYHSALIINSIEKISRFDTSIFLWEGTKPENYIYPIYFKRLKYKVIGLPHNLESLVPSQFSKITNKKSPSWLWEEMAMLKVCDVVFTISREENLLLKQFGIDAQYLPYFPAGDVYHRLLDIRTHRTRKKEIKAIKKLLMLGSIINIPTRLGMIDRIDWFVNSKPDNYKLGIAGYSTEELKSIIIDSENIVLYGSLSNDQLYDMLSEVDAVLIHQVASSGALTKIPEMLIAGIPILINCESARSYYNIDGLNIYENDAELNEYLLNEKVFRVPPLPQIPYSYFKSFLNRI